MGKKFSAICVFCCKSEDISMVKDLLTDPKLSGLIPTLADLAFNVRSFHSLL